MTGRCRRLWEVEAARDGRLVGEGLRDFELHAQACKDCRAERCAMTRLGRALAESSEAGDEVFLRRERDRLLAAADAAHRERPRSRRSLHFAVAATAAVAVWVAGTALHHKRPPWAEEPGVSITPVAGARWARSLHGNVEEISVSEGTLSVVVRHPAADHQVAVRVPDGVIEDIGTAFRVTVREGRTREIVVDDGAVVFHRMGASAFVGRGSVWVAAPEPGIPSPLPPTVTGESLAAPAITSARPSAKPRSSVLRPAVHAEPAPKPGPEDANVAAEDAAYLRIIALRRERRTDAARSAAADYLTAFPNGFRRAEVLRFALLPH